MVLVKPPTVGNFINACDRQNIHLHPDLLLGGWVKCSEPVSRLSGLIAQILAVRGPEIPLANQRLHDILPGSAAARIVGRAINSSVEPPGDCMLPDFPYTNARPERRCVTAEQEFAMALTMLRDFVGERPYHGPLLRCGGQILVDDDGRAFGLRKANGFSSTLLTRIVRVGRIICEPGWLVNYGEPGERQDYDILPPHFALRRRTDTAVIGLGRLSGFAVPADEREEKDMLAGECINMPGVADLYEHFGVEDLQPLVQQAADILAQSG